MRTKRLLVLLFLLTLAASGCSFGTPQPPQNWLGMQVSPDEWEMQETPDALYEYASLTSRALAGCRAAILATDPSFVNDYPSDADYFSSKETDTASAKIILWTVKDKDGKTLDTYFEIYDITGRSGFDLYRIAYVRVEGGNDALKCLDAVHKVIITIDPANFPDLNVAQG